MERKLMQVLEDLLPGTIYDNEDYDRLVATLEFIDDFNETHNTNVIKNLKAFEDGVYFINSEGKIEHASILRDETTTNILTRGEYMVVDPSNDYNRLYLYDEDEFDS